MLYILSRIILNKVLLRKFNRIYTDTICYLFWITRTKTKSSIVKTICWTSMHHTQRSKKLTTVAYYFLNTTLLKLSKVLSRSLILAFISYSSQAEFLLGNTVLSKIGSFERICYTLFRKLPNQSYKI